MAFFIRNVVKCTMCARINSFTKHECRRLLFDKNKSYGTKEKEHKLKHSIALSKEMKTGQFE